MDIVITGIQARRAQRIARQKNGSLRLARKIPPRAPQDICAHDVVQNIIRPALETLGVVAAGESIHMRVFHPGAQTRHSDIKVQRTSVSLPTGSFDLIVPADGSLGFTLHSNEVRIFVDGPCLCVLDIIAEQLEATKSESLSRKIIPFARGLALASEFCGVFSRDASAPDTRPAIFEVKPVLHADELRVFAEKLRRAPGVKILREVTTYLADGHGSPMEVMVYALAVVRAGLGGLHLPRPIVNRPLDLDDPQLEQISHEQLTPDLYWKQYNQAGEYDGAVHETPSQIKEDKRRIVDYQTLGITVFPATSDNFKDVDASDEYMRTLARHMEKYEGPALTRRMNRLFADEEHRKRRALLAKAVRRCW